MNLANIFGPRISATKWALNKYAAEDRLYVSKPFKITSQKHYQSLILIDRTVLLLMKMQFFVFSSYTLHYKTLISLRKFSAELEKWIV